MKQNLQKELKAIPECAVKKCFDIWIIRLLILAYRIKQGLLWRQQNEFQWLKQYFVFCWTILSIYWTECKINKII